MGASGAPRSSRLCDGLVAVLAVWTLLCNATVLLGGSLAQLWIASALSAAGALAWRVRRRGQGAAAVAPPEASIASHEAPRDERLPALESALGVAGALALVLGFATSTRLHLLWWLSVAFLLVAYLRCARRRDDAPRPHSSRGAERLVWLLAVAAAAVPLLVHKRSPDDSLYLNVAVSAADAPGARLFGADTLHGIADQPFLSAAYEVHSFELLGATLARLLGLPAIDVFHGLLPALAGLFLVLAAARLLRHLAPATWPWCLAAFALALVALTSSPQSFGYFAFLRIHQGKGVFVSVFVSLVIAYAWEFARRPDRRGWLRLCAAQVAAVGVSSTALWAAPVLATLTLVAGAAATRRGVRTLLLGVAASWHALTAGAILARAVLAETGTNLQGDEGVSLVFFRQEPIQDGATLVRAAWEIAVGHGPVAALSLFALLGAWTLAARAQTRRLLIVLPLGALLLFLNPYIAMDVAARVTVAPLFWRAFWLLPLPVMLALVLTAPLQLRGRLFTAGLAPALTAAALLAFLGLAVGTQDFPKHLRWGPFLLKINPASYAHARALVEAAPPRSHVLAAQNVSTWVPTFHRHPYPLVSRENYLLIQRARLGEEEFDRRLELQRFVSGAGPRDGLARLTAAVRADDLRAVCFAVAANAAVLRRRLTELGFHPVLVDARYETWAR